MRQIEQRIQVGTRVTGSDNTGKRRR